MSVKRSAYVIATFFAAISLNILIYPTTPVLSATYSYVGNSFAPNTFYGQFDPGQGFIYGQFTVTGPLAPNTQYINSTNPGPSALSIFPILTSYSFTDGFTLCTYNGPTTPITWFDIWTDAAGNIANWEISMPSTPSNGQLGITTAKKSSPPPSASDSVHSAVYYSGSYYPISPSDSGWVYGAQNTNNPGTWSMVITNVLIAEFQLYYATLQQAYNAFSTNVTIDAQDVTFAEDLTLNSAKNVTFQGGV